MNIFSGVSVPKCNVQSYWRKWRQNSENEIKQCSFLYENRQWKFYWHFPNHMKVSKTLHALRNISVVDKNLGLKCLSLVNYFYRLMMMTDLSQLKPELVSIYLGLWFYNKVQAEYKYSYMSPFLWGSKGEWIIGEKHGSINITLSKLLGSYASLYFENLKKVNIQVCSSVHEFWSKMYSFFFPQRTTHDVSVKFFYVVIQKYWRNRPGKQV